MTHSASLRAGSQSLGSDLPDAFLHNEEAHWFACAVERKEDTVAPDRMGMAGLLAQMSGQGTRACRDAKATNVYRHFLGGTSVDQGHAFCR